MQTDRSTNHNNAHPALHGMIAGLVFCVAAAGFFHVAPVRDMPAAMSPSSPQH